MRDSREIIKEYTPFLQGDRRLYSEEDVEKMLMRCTIEVLEDVDKTILYPPVAKKSGIEKLMEEIEANEEHSKSIEELQKGAWDAARRIARLQEERDNAEIAIQAQIATDQIAIRLLRNENGCLTQEAVKALKDYTSKERFDKLMEPINLQNPAQEILDKLGECIKP